MEPAREPDNLELFKLADEKIDRIRNDVTNLMREDLGLNHKMDILMTQQSALKERVEEGVAKTAYKTWEKVSELSNQIKDFQHDLHLQEKTLDTHTAKIDANSDELRWIRRGIFAVVFISLLGMAMKYLLQL